MPAAMKIIVTEFLAAQPHIGVLELAIAAIDDHIVKNGCEFEENAAVRAVERLGVSPTMKAADLPKERVTELGDMLEAMESNCPHKGEKTVCLAS